MFNENYFTAKLWTFFEIYNSKNLPERVNFRIKKKCNFVTDFYNKNFIKLH
jgi:hypothetical protein